MACEFLLLDKEDEGSKLLLIEEPEAHLHAQRQLRAMKFLQDQAKEKGIQIIVTTHSPNLASAIDLNNIVMVHNERAYSMAEGQTELEPSDYRFLQRFLDVTKANLFFARGVMIVEGPAENILLPTLARLLGRDFTDRGVSLVNVCGTGLRRYARIFKRSGVTDEEKQLKIPVACVTDMDVMPNCGGKITGKTLDTKEKLGEKGLKDRRASLRAKASGQCVETFVSDEWTLEYDLAHSGLAEDVYVAAHLAKKDMALDKTSRVFDAATVSTETAAAEKAFKNLEIEAKTAVEEENSEGCSCEDVLACMVFAEFTKRTKVSKAIAAQYLAERLQARFQKKEQSGADLRANLPNYITSAIEFVTGGAAPPDAETTAGRTTNG